MYNFFGSEKKVDYIKFCTENFEGNNNSAKINYLCSREGRLAQLV